MNNKNLISFAFIFFILSSSISGQKENNSPKNVILFIGDGMGLTQISSKILSTKKETVFEAFENIGFVKTHSNSSLITDSGAAATAMATGQKTYNNSIGLSVDTLPAPNLLEIATKKGYSTGILVTSPITHATPAAFYAHSQHRVNKEEIALQLSNLNIDLLIGGGRESFFDRESDEKNLLDTLLNKGYKIIDNTTEKHPNLNDYGRNEKVIYFAADFFPTGAITGRDYLPYYCRSAPLFLSRKDTKGFILIVESSQLDLSLHSNSTLEFKAEMSDAEASIQNF